MKLYDQGELFYNNQAYNKALDISNILNFYTSLSREAIADVLNTDEYKLVLEYCGEGYFPKFMRGILHIIKSDGLTINTCLKRPDNQTLIDFAIKHSDSFEEFRCLVHQSFNIELILLMNIDKIQTISSEDK